MPNRITRALPLALLAFAPACDALDTPENPNGNWVLSSDDGRSVPYVVETPIDTISTLEVAVDSGKLVLRNGDWVRGVWRRTRTVPDDSTWAAQEIVHSGSYTYGDGEIELFSVDGGEEDGTWSGDRITIDGAVWLRD